MDSQFVQRSVMFTDLLPIDHNVHEHACHAIIHMLPGRWLPLPTTPSEVFKSSNQFLSNMKKLVGYIGILPFLCRKDFAFPM